jgi:hypothetical protein
VKQVNGAAHGIGIYSSEQPDMAMNYITVKYK